MVLPDEPALLARLGVKVDAPPDNTGGTLSQWKDYKGYSIRVTLKSANARFINFARIALLPR